MFYWKNLVGHCSTAFKIVPLDLIFFFGNLFLFREWKPEIQQEKGENRKDLMNNTGSFRNKYLIQEVQ